MGERLCSPITKFIPQNLVTLEFEDKFLLHYYSNYLQFFELARLSLQMFLIQILKYTVHH